MLSKNNTDRYTPDFTIMIKIAILNSLGFFFMGFLIPIISRQNMNATGLEIGLIVSAMVIGYTLSSSFIGFITDRTKSKRFLIFIGSTGRGVSYLIFYISIIINALTGMWIGMFVLGFWAGFFWIPFDTLVAEKSNKNHRSQAFGKRDSANAIGQMIGAIIGFSILLIVRLFNDNPYYLYSAILIFGIANFIAGILFLMYVDETIKFYDDKVTSNENLDNNIKSSIFNFPKPMMFGLIVLFCVVLMASINGNLAKPFLNIYIIENLSDNLYIVVLIYLPSGLLATFLAPKLGEIVDKLEPRIAIVILSFSGAIITWFLVNTKDLLLFAILLLLDMTIAISAGLLFRNLLSRITIEHRGKILGISSFSANIGSIIGPILGGFVWDISGPKAPFIVSIFVELCLIPLYFIVVHLLLPHVAETYDKNE